MDTIIQPAYTVGAQQGPFANGAIINAALGPHAEILASQLDAQYRHGVRNSETFTICLQSATTTTVALATTYTGICLFNPVTSKKNLSILKVSCSLWAAPATIVSVGLLGGWSAAGITPANSLSPYNSKTLVAAAPNGQGSSGCTLVGTPIWICMLNSANTNNALSTANSPVFHDFGGCIEVPPGGYVAIGTQTVASVVGSITWREVDP